MAVELLVEHTISTSSRRHSPSGTYLFTEQESTAKRHKSKSRTFLNDIITPNFKKFLQIYENLRRIKVDLHYFNEEETDKNAKQEYTQADNIT
jgi:hypothetical protein